MPLRIEDYAMIGDTRTAALVGLDGSIDWLCLPRFDSGACFAALLGDERHGRWSIAPASEIARVERRYRPGTLVLETEFHTADGVVRLVDCMPLSDTTTEVARVVEGVGGRVAMRMDLALRFDYGRVVPWVRRLGGALSAVAEPDAVLLAAAVPTRGENMTTRAEFEVGEGESVPFLLTWYPSEQRPPGPIDVREAVSDTAAWWQDWSARGVEAGGPWREQVQRSLITLKALTYENTGGIVAAPTTSLSSGIQPHRADQQRDDPQPRGAGACRGARRELVG